MLVTEINPIEYRRSEYDIEPMLLRRWSPRAMSAEEISETELMTLFEAARWAPSSYNAQPWRFVYARRGTEHWNRFFDLLAELNQAWAKNAAVLMIVLSRKISEKTNKPAPTHAFDAGAAWQNLALQASAMGLIAHGMEGFDFEKARQVANAPDEYEVRAMIAVGKAGEREKLPGDLEEREQPSRRKAVSEITVEGCF